MIEGADGSGKGTQTRLLAKSLEEYGPVVQFEFPRYKNSAFGNLIKRCLGGEFGNFLELSPYLSSLPYILDRVRAKYLLLESLKDGHVICDRYTPSNIAYQSAKLSSGERKEFIEFIESGEYEELGLPAPDLVIYLSVPVETSAQLIKERRAKGKAEVVKDIHESNLEYQRKVADVYRYLSKERSNWKIVDCVKGGKLLPREDVHQKVVKIVKEHLKLK